MVWWFGGLEAWISKGFGKERFGQLGKRTASRLRKHEQSFVCQEDKCMQLVFLGFRV